MTQTACRRLALTVLVFGIPIAARADLNQTITLQTNTALNLDTGATASSGLDILWNGSTMTPQGSATAVSIYPDFPAGQYSTISAILVQLFPGYSKSAIAAADLTVGNLFGVHTNGNHYAKALVTANSGGAITLQFTTFGVAAGTGGGGTAGPPTITAIKNNSSGIAPGLPNYGIAPSSLFIVQGTGLADPGDPVLQPSNVGLPLTLNGASITVVVNGVTNHPAMWYTSPTQIAAVLPAGTPIGTGTLTVTYKNVTSAPAALKVVPFALGINSYGINSGVATDATTGAVLTYTNSGTPGETVTLWTTGLGADPADSDTTFSPNPQAVNTPLQIYFGGTLAKILYQGSSGYPGVNQINLVIPDTIPAGCWIPLVAVSGTVVSNTVTFPISKSGGSCLDPISGLSGNQIAPQGGQTLKTGLVALIREDRTNTKGVHTISSTTDAAFEKYTGIYSPANSVSPGGCIVNDLTPVPVGTITGLDVGTITLTGPGGLAVTLASQLGIKGAFFANLATAAIPTTGGTFTFKGSGGTDVGSFTSTITLSNPLLTWTNTSAAATIDRTKGFQVTWTGGNPGTYVVIGGTSGTATVPSVIGAFTCLAPVEAGQFTVPSYILQALPAGSGGINMQNDIYIPLTATGIDIGTADATITFSVPAAFQ